MRTTNYTFQDAQLTINDTDIYENCFADINIREERFTSGRYTQRSVEIDGELRFPHPFPMDAYFGPDDLPDQFDAVIEDEEKHLELESAMIRDGNSGGDKIEIIAMDWELEVHEQEPVEVLSREEFLPVAAALVNGDHETVYQFFEKYGPERGRELLENSALDYGDE
jgi:hypothetical protein